VARSGREQPRMAYRRRFLQLFPVMGSNVPQHAHQGFLLEGLAEGRSQSRVHGQHVCRQLLRWTAAQQCIQVSSVHA
jgi:hypothetical protein